MISVNEQFIITEKQAFSVADVNVKIKEGLHIDDSDGTMRKTYVTGNFKWRGMNVETLDG